MDGPAKTHCQAPREDGAPNSARAEAYKRTPAKAALPGDRKTLAIKRAGFTRVGTRGKRLQSSSAPPGRPCSQT